MEFIFLLFITNMNHHVNDKNALLPSEVEGYKSNGYHLHKKQLFSAEKLNALTAIFETHLAAKGSKLSDELDTPHFSDRRLLPFLLSNEVLDLVQPLIGENIGLFSSHFICKDAYTGRRTPWHEDSAYWKGKFDKLDKIVTVWLAIDDSNLSNGCMGVIPGTHINGYSEYVALDDIMSNTFDSEIKKGSFNEEDAIWLELKKGECSLHDARIIHGAGANASPQRRCGYTMRYFCLDMKFNGHSEHLLWHARGENIAGNVLQLY